MENNTQTLPRKTFTVIIHKKTYDVYSIEGKEHEGLNDVPKTWWLYYSDRLPEGIAPPLDSPYWEPFSNSINRLCWDIRFSQGNSSKYKWGANQFRNNTVVEMYCNDKLVYKFSTIGEDRGMSYAMAKAQYLQTVMAEHPFNFFEPEKEIGRKIWWFGLPATIVLGYEPGEIRIAPDYSTGIDQNKWWKLYKERRAPVQPNEESREDDESIFSEDDGPRSIINWGDALSDGNINWFRK